MIRLKNVRHPRSAADAKHLAGLSGVMMRHHVRTPWWNLRLKVETYVSARAYAKRASEWTT